MSILLKSNNKIYSLKSEEILYETKMTSNTAPAPFVASASSINSTSYPAWRAFNGINISSIDNWRSGSSSNNGWVQLDFGKSTKVNVVHISIKNDTDFNRFSPKHFEILGSNNGVDFNVLGEYHVSDWKQAERKTFKIKKSNFRYYRVNVLETNGNVYVIIGLIEFEFTENTLINIPSDSIGNFIEYGVSSIDNFNLINTNKNYVLSKNESENADGLWVQEIDRKPLSIKFE